MIIHIVIDESKDVLKTYADMYRVFTDFDKAYDHALSCGYDPSWMGKPKPTLGHKITFQAGATNVSILTTEVTE